VSTAHTDRPRVGLALSGGSARGIAHIGVLKALEEASIPIDMIAGTSAGAAVGACYAYGTSMATLEEVILGVDWKALARFADPNLIFLGRGIVQGQRVRSLLNSIIGDVTFEELATPLSIVAADVENMEQVVLNAGSVIDAVRASISLPVVFAPVKVGGRFLIDGGVANPVPVSVLREMGAELVIAVNVLAAAQPKLRQPPRLTPAPRRRASKSTAFLDDTRLSLVKTRIDDLIEEHRDTLSAFDELASMARKRFQTTRERLDPNTPTIFSVLMQLIHAVEHEKMRSSIHGADLVITPALGNIGAFGFQRGAEAITQGYDAARTVLPRLRDMTRCP